MTTIRHEITTTAPRDRAFDAFATADGLRAWWSKDCDIATEVGGEHVMRFHKDGRTVTMKFRIDELTPNERVRWTCVANDNPVWPDTTLDYVVKANDGGTKVTLEHAGFAEDASPPYQMTVQGWQHFVNSLRAHLDGKPGEPWG